MWYIHTIEYYSVIKRSELSSHRNLTCMLVSERSQSEKSLYCYFIYVIVGKKQNYEDSRKISDCQGLSDWEGRMNK
jgi:hypothetical protein